MLEFRHPYYRHWSKLNSEGYIANIESVNKSMIR